MASDLKTDFDIGVLLGIDAADCDWANLMFHRRHLFTHRGGIVDQKYLDDSADTTVQLGQLVRETKENVHRLLSLMVRIARNLHHGFHAIIQVHQEPIKYHQEAEARRKRAQQT